MKWRRMPYNPYCTKVGKQSKNMAKKKQSTLLRMFLILLILVGTSNLNFSANFSLATPQKGIHSNHVERQSPYHVPPLNRSTGSPIDEQTHHSMPSSIRSVTGNRKLLVILIDFPDKVGSKSSSYFNDLLFSGISGSLNHYFSEISYGQLSILGSVLEIWVRSEHTKDWWGEDSTSGLDDANTEIWRLAKEAVQLADPYVDYSIYDVDHDGYVEAEEVSICVVHAGDGQESSHVSSDIWSHQGSINENIAVDGVKLYYHSYTMQAETSPMGTFAHELGHDFGLPDLYDTSYQQEFVGKWDLMDIGSWNGDPQGSCPSHPTSWCKIKLGWITSSKIYIINDGQTATVTVAPLENTTANYYTIKLPLTAHSYYLIEVRQKTGYDVALPDNGVLVLYCDDNIESGSGPVRLRDAYSSTSTLDDAAFDIGYGENSVYQDEANTITVTVLSTDGSSFSIRVSRTKINRSLLNIALVSISPYQGYLSSDLDYLGYSYEVYNEQNVTDLFAGSPVKIYSYDVVLIGRYAMTSVAYTAAANILKRAFVNNAATLLNYIKLGGGLVILAESSYSWLPSELAQNTELGVRDGNEINTYYVSHPIVTSVKDLTAYTGSETNVGTNILYQYHFSQWEDEETGTPHGIYVSIARDDWTLQTDITVWIAGEYGHGKISITTMDLDYLSGLISKTFYNNRYALDNMIWWAKGAQVVIDQVLVSDSRADLGTTQYVYFHAKWKYVEDDAAGATIYVDNNSYTTNSTGWITISATSSTVGRSTWSVGKIEYNGEIRSAQTVPNPLIIWDRLEVYDSGVSGTRCSVGTNQVIWVRLRYDYDDVTFDEAKGSLSIGEVAAIWDSINGYWYAYVSGNTVGKNDYIIPSNFVDKTYELTGIVGQVNQSIIWDRIKITGMGNDDDRRDIGTAGMFWVTAALEYDDHPLGSNDRLTINGIDLVWNAVNNRFEGTDSKSIVTAVTYDMFTSGKESTYGITAGTMNNYSTTIIWDRLIVSFKGVDDDRRDVGTTGEVRFRLKSEYDNTLVNSGSVLINGTPAIYDASNSWWKITYTLNSVSSRKFIITGAVWDTYGITALNSGVATNSTAMIWDRFEFISITANSSRVNVNQKFELRYTIRYDYDDVIFDNSKGSIAGFTWNAANSWWSKNVTASPIVGLTNYDETYIIVKDETYGLTAKQDVTGISIITDRLIISFKGVDDERRNINTAGEIRYRLRSEYDGSAVTSGSVNINGTPATWDAANSWWKIEYILETVGSRNFIVSSANWDTYGITALNPDVLTNSTSIIWDELVVTLSTSDDRVDVGSNVTISFEIHRKFDSSIASSFSIAIRGNNTIWYRNSGSSINDSSPDIGRYVYTCSAVTDNTYDLTKFESNNISVVFDKVVITLSGPERLQVGTAAEITYQALYLYDKTPFEGKILLNNSQRQTSIGEYMYTVKAIEDQAYGLKDFSSNSILVIFDDIVVKYDVSNSFPGSVLIRINLMYMSDLTPVKDAIVEVNGETAKHIDQGIYELQTQSWLPAQLTSITVSKTKFDVKRIGTVTLLITNFFGYATIILIVTLIILHFRKPKNTQKF